MERHLFSPGQNTNVNVPDYTPMKLSLTVAIIRNYTAKINKNKKKSCQTLPFLPTQKTNWDNDNAKKTTIELP